MLILMRCKVATFSYFSRSNVVGEANLQLQALELDASLEQYQVSKINYEKIQSVHGGVLGHMGVNRTILENGILSRKM